MQEEGWVVCRAFKKKATAQSNNKSMEGWDSSNYFYEGHEAVMDTSDRRRHHYLSRSINPPSFMPLSSSSHSYFCKQEFDHQNSTNMNNLNIFMQSDHPFLQLPQLESPSLPMLKRPINNNNNNNNDLEEIDQLMNKGQSSMDKVTDWRALDKFVASQLSHDNNNEQPGDHHIHNHPGIGSSFGGLDHHTHNESADMALFIRDEEGGEGEEDTLINGFLASTSESELGVCIFDK